MSSSREKKLAANKEKAKSILFAGGFLDQLSAMGENEPLGFENIEIDLIESNPFQPRQYFNQDSLQQLADTISEHGFFGHLLLRQKGRRYQLVYGERRLKAAKMAGLAVLPVQIRELNDQEMLEIALTENIQREDLHPIDEALGYQKMKEQLGCSIRDISKRVSKSVGYVQGLLSLLRYDDVAAAVQRSNIPTRTAEELAKIKDRLLRKKLTNLVILGELTRSQLIEERKAIKEEKGSLQRVKPKKKASFAPIFQKTLDLLEKQDWDSIESGKKKREAIQFLQEISERSKVLLKKLES